jgi:hypothetical protein
MTNLHQFHIPVMGTSFTIDSPIKVAPFGIDSVISLCDDELCEYTRQHYCLSYNLPYSEIPKYSHDYRAKRIREYLNLVHSIVNLEITKIQSQAFETDSQLDLYFKLLPDTAALKIQYEEMCRETEQTIKNKHQDYLRKNVKAGSIDVNIMTKLDRDNYDKAGNQLSVEFSDALAALRGYAESTLESGIVFSAGFNRRLYAYMSEFEDFYPNADGFIKKRVIMKVSDYRSSLTQAKFLAKKGIWISEHRIESGLNCGGHAFASDGYLLGPILEEFKEKKSEFTDEMYNLCNIALKEKSAPEFKEKPNTLITVQGGIGTSSEQQFLLRHYRVDKTGWATPFLLVPEATTVDDETLITLQDATPKDLYLSRISPLGVPFNTVKNTKSEKQKLERFESGRPGSPCPKGYLVSNQKYSKKPVCTASIFYQKREIQTLSKDNSGSKLDKVVDAVIQKACLCEDLAAGALIKYGQNNKRPLSPAVCPGPNLAFFSKISSLKEMVDHIYGRFNVSNQTKRNHMLINELKMYIDYFKSEISLRLPKLSRKDISYINLFRTNLENGIQYYKKLFPKVTEETTTNLEIMLTEMDLLNKQLKDSWIYFSNEVKRLSLNNA